MLVLVELTVVFVTIALALPIRCRLSLPGRAARRQSWRKGTGGKCRSPAALLAKDAVPWGTRILTREQPNAESVGLSYAAPWRVYRTDCAAG